MSPTLPDRASYDYLKKLAKERLAVLRVADPSARLADAQLALARDYGFASWRALKAEMDRRKAPHVGAFVRACRAGDVAALRDLLTIDPALARARVASGTTGLHLAARHPDALRLLLAQGADPNARDDGDHATPLHFAAASGSVDSVRVLIDAGADVHGEGDLHDGSVIGWAARRGNEAVIDLLLANGARHHLFSAMAMGDRELVRTIVQQDRRCLATRRSRFENGQTPLHAAFAPPDGLGYLAGAPDYAMLALLLELGAPVEATDGKGRTPLAVATLRGDREAMRLLEAAGASALAPARAEDPEVALEVAALAASVRMSDPMFRVSDMRATIRWYESIGFTVRDQYEEDGDMRFAKLAFGSCVINLTPGTPHGPRDVSLWLYTDRVEELYRLIRRRQLQAVSAAGVDASQGGVAAAVPPEVRFTEDLYSPFYGGRQFSIEDNNGVSLIFWQPD